jgi:hypothetical protein
MLVARTDHESHDTPVSTLADPSHPQTRPAFSAAESPTAQTIPSAEEITQRLRNAAKVALGEGGED